MAEVNRPLGRLEEVGYEAWEQPCTTSEEALEILAEDAYANAQAEIAYDVMEGQCCPGCEIPIQEDKGIECFCSVEGFSRDHERMLWCSQECQDKTHEIAYPMPPEVES